MADMAEVIKLVIMFGAYGAAILFGVFMIYLMLALDRADEQAEDEEAVEVAEKQVQWSQHINC